MCVAALALTPGLMTGLQIASSVIGLVGQMQAQSAQEEANQRQYEATMKARAANVNQTNLMQQQEREAAMQKMEQNNMEARAAQATATVSSGEAGISGLSVDALLEELGTKQNRFNSSVETNYDRSSSAIALQRENVDIDAASQIAALRTPQMPDYAGTALRIGQSLYDYKNPKV
jgi:hypothetical protein